MQIPNIFTNFSPKIFSWNQSCQQLKSPKPQHFHEFFTQKNHQFFRDIKVEFLDKKWRFRTVCFMSKSFGQSWEVIRIRKNTLIHRFMNVVTKSKVSGHPKLWQWAYLSIFHLAFSLTLFFLACQRCKCAWRQRMSTIGPTIASQKQRLTLQALQPPFWMKAWLGTWIFLRSWLCMMLLTDL